MMTGKMNASPAKVSLKTGIHLEKEMGKVKLFLIFVLFTFCLLNALNVLVEVLFNIFNKQGGLFQQLLNFLRK